MIGTFLGTTRLISRTSLFSDEVRKMSIAICPDCDTEIDQTAERSSTPEYDDLSVMFDVKCPGCGKVFKDDYTYSGIWDPETEEYIYID